MKLFIRGIPRRQEPLSLETGDSGAILGRMEGDNTNGLRIPIPHIDHPKAGEPKTDSLSRQHLRFDFKNGAWYVTWIGRLPTFLNDVEMTAQTVTRLPSDATLRIGELRLDLSTEDPFATRAIRPGPSPAPQADQNPFATRAIHLGRPPEVGVMEPVSVSGLGAQTKTMLEQMLTELERVTTSCQEIQQKRSLSEQAREEANVAVASVRQASSLTQLQSAAERVRDAAERSRQAAERTAAATEAVRRSLDRSREIERSLKSMASDATRAMARLSPNDPSGRALSAQMSHAEDEARRRMAELEEQSARALGEREKALVSSRAATEVENEALNVASKRETEFRQKERFIALARRYAIIVVVLLAAIVVGLLMAYLLDAESPDALNGTSSLRDLRHGERGLNRPTAVARSEWSRATRFIPRPV